MKFAEFYEYQKTVKEPQMKESVNLRVPRNKETLLNMGPDLII